MGNRCLYATGGVGSVPYALRVTNSDCINDDVYWTTELVASPVPGYRLHPYADVAMCLAVNGTIANISSCTGTSAEIWSDTLVSYTGAKFKLQPYSQAGLCLTAGTSSIVGLALCDGSDTQIFTDPVRCSGWWPFKSCKYVSLPNVANPTKGREFAANYALQWYNSTNAAYSHLGMPAGKIRAANANDPSREDDCTNFVSQALTIGGFETSGVWKYDQYTKTSLSAWTRAGGSGSLPVTFTSLGRFQSPISFTGKNVPAGIRVGDVISADFQTDGSIDHNTVVVENGTTSKTLWIAYHTRDSRISFDEFVNRLSDSLPQTTFYWYRVNYPDGL